MGKALALCLLALTVAGCAVNSDRADNKKLNKANRTNPSQNTCPNVCAPKPGDQFSLFVETEIKKQKGEDKARRYYKYLQSEPMALEGSNNLYFAYEVFALRFGQWANKYGPCRRDKPCQKRPHFIFHFVTLNKINENSYERVSTRSFNGFFSPAGSVFTLVNFGTLQVESYSKDSLQAKLDIEKSVLEQHKLPLKQIQMNYIWSESIPRDILDFLKL